MSPTERQKQDRADAMFGQWVRERLAAQKPERWTQVRLRDELAQRGHEVKREWVNQVINGKHASPELRAAIESILGASPATLAEPGPEPTLAAALSELAAELRASRKERETVEVRLRALEAETRSLREQLAAAGSPVRSVPGGTTG